jgi:hypothetical protein
LLFNMSNYLITFTGGGYPIVHVSASILFRGVIISTGSASDVSPRNANEMAVRDAWDKFLSMRNRIPEKETLWDECIETPC